MTVLLSRCPTRPLVELEPRPPFSVAIVVCSAGRLAAAWGPLVVREEGCSLRRVRRPCSPPRSSGRRFADPFSHSVVPSTVHWLREVSALTLAELRSDNCKLPAKLDNSPSPPTLFASRSPPLRSRRRLPASNAEMCALSAYPNSASLWLCRVSALFLSQASFTPPRSAP